MKKLILFLGIIFSADMLSAQQIPPTGLLRPTEQQLKKVPRPAAGGIPLGTPIPNSWDLSQFMPVSGDQGLQGSCAAFSTVYDCLTFLENRKNNSSPNAGNVIDSTKVYSPKYLFNQLKSQQNPPDGDCTIGVYFVDILDAVRDQGSPTLKQLPYKPEVLNDCLQPILPAELKTLAQQNKIVGYESQYYSNVSEIENDVANNWPVMFAMEIDSDFWFKGNIAASKPEPYIYKFNPQKDYGYHALIVVGYDKGTGLFKILNSWGPNWGNNGYFYMTFADFMNSRKEAYIAKASTTTAISSNALLSNVNSVIKLGVGGRYQGYFRLGFYKRFDEFNIGINFINKNKGEIILSILSPNKKEIIANMFLIEDQTKYFSYQKQRINITFSGIDIDGIAAVQNDVLLTIKITNDAPDPILKRLLDF